MNRYWEGKLYKVIKVIGVDVFIIRVKEVFFVWVLIVDFIVEGIGNLSCFKIFLIFFIWKDFYGYIGKVKFLIFEGLFNNFWGKDILELVESIFNISD